MAIEGLRRIRDLIWEVPSNYKPGMRVPTRIFMSEKLINEIEREAVIQAINVATLPGIQKYSIAMPEAHVGYGFPIGGVAAFDLNEGIVSPGGVGYDINCGVRLLTTNLKIKDIKGRIQELIAALYNAVPCGVGSKSELRIYGKELDEVFVKGAEWAVEKGYGSKADLEHCEEHGAMKGADPAKVSDKAKQRGTPQLGTLGSGNHFLEVQVVKEIYNPEVAKVFGLEKDQITVKIHSGSRGAGHQICTDYLRILERATVKYGIKLPDKQLACAPINSQEGRDYLAAMAAAANYAWANRQMMTHWVRGVFKKLFGISEDEMPLLYDVAHNVAKLEEHIVNGERKKVYVHRKGATRAFGPKHEDVPAKYRSVGQPVLIPGSMGTSSYVLHGTEEAMKLTFGSTCHGAGRTMSRTSGLKEFRGAEVKKRLAEQGIIVMAPSYESIAEEAPEVYKSVDEVVDVVHRVGISRKVAKLVPLGVTKG